MAIIQEIWEEFEAQLAQVDLLDMGYEAGIERYKALCDQFILDNVKAQLEAYDTILMEETSLRRDWICVRKAPRTLQTKHGTLTYTRRYYRHRASGDHSHLIDLLVGLSPYKRVDPALRLSLARLGSEMSYRKSTSLACEGAVSHQTVMTSLRDLKIPEIPVIERKEEVPVIHIQADEDHISLQSRACGKKRRGIVKLAALHDPIQVKGSRRYIPAKYVMTDGEGKDNEVFWERVYEQLIARYGDLGNRPVYIHGDGAPWIKKGEEIIPNSHYVLDRFHLEKALRRACPKHKAPGRWRRLHKLLDQSELEKLALEIWACAQEGVCSRETAMDTIHYLVNNWEGIEIANDPGHATGGSCAEGLVGHILSARLSTHAMSWSRQGAAKMAALRAFLVNGGELTSDLFEEPQKPTAPAIPKPSISLRNYRFCGSPATAPWTNKRGTPLYRLQKAITDGGLGRVH